MVIRTYKIHQAGCLIRLDRERNPQPNLFNTFLKSTGKRQIIGRIHIITDQCINFPFIHFIHQADYIRGKSLPEIQCFTEINGLTIIIKHEIDLIYDLLNPGII